MRALRWLVLLLAFPAQATVDLYRADDMRRVQAPLVDETRKERAHRVGRDQLRPTVRVAKTRQVDRNYASDGRHPIPHQP